jgi:L-seryl-tRNA(Ser) seleniumtransferase
LLVDAARSALAAGGADQFARQLRRIERSLTQPVINATGVIVHTNLGRAPWGVDVAPTYCNLELDLTTGKRSTRRGGAGALIARACGAEDALVVNNGAAAVWLVLAALAADRGVAVSRGELVEIGGGFRLPDVMEASGARLVEVGTTNKTRVSDYRRVLDRTAILMKVHRSNFQLAGFVEDASVEELADLERPLIADIGSGLLDAACPWLVGGPPAWLESEPAARQTLAAGAALVIFSGDKLMGGPQAGLIAGDAQLVDRCVRHPLYRVVRPSGLVLTALQNVALAYLNNNGTAIPFWRMATTSVEELRHRAHGLGVGEVVDCYSVPGGGTLPGVEIPSAGVSLPGDVTASLRATRPKAVIARVADGSTILDLRTVDPEDDRMVCEAVHSATR